MPPNPELQPESDVVDRSHLDATIDVFSRPLFHLPGVVTAVSASTGRSVTVRRAPFTLAQAEEMAALRQEGAPAFTETDSGVIRRLSSLEQEHITSV